MERAQLGLRTAEIAVGADTLTPGPRPDPTTTPTTLIDRNRRLMLHSLCQLNSGSPQRESVVPRALTGASQPKWGYADEAFGRHLRLDC
jgi:hypothetical protein